MQLIYLTLVLLVSSVLSVPMSSFYKRRPFYKRSSGCTDKYGMVRAAESFWEVGCTERCYCVEDNGSYRAECGPYVCAIPVLKFTSNCAWVDNPKRNDETGQNCCPILQCGGDRRLYSGNVFGKRR